MNIESKCAHFQYPLSCGVGNTCIHVSCSILLCTIHNIPLEEPHRKELEHTSYSLIEWKFCTRKFKNFKK